MQAPINAEDNTDTESDTDIVKMRKRTRRYLLPGFWHLLLFYATSRSADKNVSEEDQKNQALLVG